MEAILFNQQGQETGKIALLDAVFGKVVSPSLIHRLLRVQMSNARIAIAHTKTRSDRAGSTRKLYKQKWTGNARAGDARSPTRRGGWVAFGPSNERNFTLRMNKKERRAALFSLLSSKAQEQGIKVIESFSNDVIQTKVFLNLAAKMQLSNWVVAVTPSDAHVFQGGRNVPTLKVIGINYLNPHDILKYRDLVFTTDSLEALYDHYSITR